MDIKIFGVKISKITKNELFEKINNFLSDNKQHYIVTPNPEILLTACGDDDFWHILNLADLSLPDGIGLKLAAWAMGDNLNRFTGADLLKDIITLANDGKYRIAFLLWDKGLVRKNELEQKIKNYYSNLLLYVEEINKNYDNINFDNLSNFKPEILIVALGAPSQEKFIYYNITKISSVKLAIGVGGAIDYYVGKTKRAPRFFRLIGLEWLIRVILQPRRWKRIFNAVIVFPLEFVKQNYINKFFYRKNVVGMVVDNNNEVLILNKDNHWGLPQGGIDKGENFEEALSREMKEEIGTNNFSIVSKFVNIYKYKWPRSYTNTGYKGQEQSLFILKYTGDKSEIKINTLELKDYKWIKIDDMIIQSDPVHAKAYKLFLDKYYETKI